MGQEFLNKENDTSRKSYTEVFYEQLPFYLAIGMSLTEYFEGDCLLAKYFREAYRLKQEQDDYNAWLQGLYFYKALDCALYNNPPLMKRGSEPKMYFKEPILREQQDEINEEKLALEKEEQEAKMGVWLNNFVNMYKGNNL